MSVKNVYNILRLNKKQPGWIISFIVHGLVMLIPISSILVERYEELEMFIMNEEKPVTQSHRVVDRKIEKKIDPKVIEFPKIIEPLKEEVREIPEEKKEAKEEVKVKEEEKIVAEKVVEKPIPETIPKEEPIFIREESPVPLSVSISVVPKEVEPSEKPSPPPPVPLSLNQKNPEPLPTAKETVHLGPTQPLEVEFGAREGPKFLRKVLPVYPVMARRMGKEGRVVLKLLIDERGNLSQLEVIERAGYGFTEAAVEAVKKSSFLPAFKDGKPVASIAILPIRFNLRSEE